MTPLYGILIFLFSILVVGAAAVLIGAVIRGAEARAEAERAQAQRETIERRVASRLEMIKTPEGSRAVKYRGTELGDYFTFEVVLDPSKEFLTTAKGIADLCKEGRMSSPGCGSLSWGPGPDTLRAMAEVERAKAPHYHLAQSQSPTNGDKNQNQGKKPWQKDILG